MPDPELQELLDAGERPWIDFKERHHDSPARLLHDILCLANAHHEGDRYLLFGVNDRGEPVGLSDPTDIRRTLADLNSFLGQLNLNRTPSLDMRPFTSPSGHPIDCLVVKRTRERPYFMQKDYRHGKDTVRAGVPYTRNADANTPMDGAPTDAQLEEMFRDRLGLNLSAEDRLRFLLRKPGDWTYKEDSDGRVLYYHRGEPAFRIHERPSEYSSPFTEPWTKEFINRQTRRNEYRVLHNDTELATVFVLRCDGGRFTTVMPEVKTWLDEPDGHYTTYWFASGSLRVLVNDLIKAHNPDWGGLPITVDFPVLESVHELEEDFRAGRQRFTYYRVTNPATSVYRIKQGLETEVGEDAAE